MRHSGLAVPGVLGLAVMLVSGHASGQGVPRPCVDASECLAGQVCEFPIGDCTGVNGICVTTPTCDTGAVCGCDGADYPDACAATAAGTVAEFIGACPIPPSCAAGTCVGDYFCVLPDGFCRDFGFLPCDSSEVWEPDGHDFGTCTAIGDSCVFVDDPVCGCDGVTYSNRCWASMNRMSAAYTGVCSGESCNSTTDPCSDPDDTCVGVCGSCSADWGRCRQDPGTCDDSCAPVCDCGGTWFRNECEAVAAGAGMDLVQPGNCDETYAVQFASKNVITWSAIETGGETYNLYRSTVTGAGVHGPWDCIVPTIPSRPYGVGGPPPSGQVWLYVVTQVSAGIEGALGYGGAGCSPRIASTPCPP